ncbi:MAG: RNA-binding protein [Xanthomonadales bacterium]|nr:RNA-binding protein [Xanthomonadales bacterium]NNK37684.1 RNA-binding protein [Xanthomonadales bacterium]
MKKLFVGNLPSDTTEESVRGMFSAYGTVRSVDLARDIFTGNCKGFCFIEMEGHEARAAQAALDGHVQDGGGFLKVRFEQPRRRGRGRR